jgi:tripartite-type tricarboxylate transporter receptor subunit TctC
MNRRWVGLLIAGAWLAAPQLQAQPAHPAKPIRVMVPGAAGSPPDALARIIADALARTTGEPLAALGRPVIVENRPGGIGTLALGAVAKAPPDGNTLGVIGLTQLVAPSLLPEIPYDFERDLAPVTQLVWTANVLVVRASSPLATPADFVALAKAKPRRLTYATAGNGTPSHLAAALFMHHAGIDVQHVPFRGIPAGLAALMGEQVDVAFSGIATALPLVQSGKLRALGTAAARRLPGLPDLATISEAGYPGYQLNEWYGLAAPSGTPPELVARLANDLARVVALPETEARLLQLGLYPAEKTGPEALAALIRTEGPRWKAIVREADIRAN